ncbi:MAG TPA: zinc-finger domain-containing protein [Caldimonas sp.]|jgi:uncharacterized Zn-finger protein|nr:zinc-finger domain-containing protein [Caldimonas sp.]HEX2540653.1 zinc-finger domain-containing protein [Caldimonas sp.]
MADPGLSAMANDGTREAVELSASELQGPGVIFCPNPRMPLWSNHPRVFIDVASAGVGKCPYCGTEYRLKAGEKVPSH